MRYLIIGNSAAAISAVEAIRERDAKNEVTLFSDEPYFTYSRPLISYLLAEDITEERMFYRDENFYGRNKVEAILGKKVVCIDAAKREVVTERGERLPFDKLLIATGGKPIVPDLRGMGSRGIFTFTKWEDAKEIKKFVQEIGVKNAVVVGGGLIGLKATEALMALGIKVTIVELLDRILSATFDRTASELMRKILEDKGCEVVTGTTVDEIVAQEGKVSGVILKNGVKRDCEVVILAIGVTPNVGIAKDAGIKVNRGILVNEYMQTNFPYIYAAGDVAEAYDLILNVNRPIAIWPNATIQGTIAGHNMAGARDKYQGSFAMNSVELCGIPTISMGLTEPAGDGYEVLQQLEEEKHVYRKIVLKDNVIVGTIFVNDIDRAGIFTSLIKDKIDVKDFKGSLLAEDFGLAWFPKEYRKHLVVGPGVEV